jgi:anti-sigma-K factor RskA
VNIQEYINSGIVENYVLGLSDAEESSEFERLCLQYPELATAKKVFEEALEKHALENAAMPPAPVKQRFLEAIKGTTSSKVIQMEPVNAPARKNGWLRFTAAAAVLLLVVAAWFAYQFYAQNERLQNSNKNLQAELYTKDSLLNKIVDEQKIVSDPNMIVVNLEGTVKTPQSSASIYWDSTTANVYLVVKNMPKLPNDQQYQLWAIIDGKPKDLGVFDRKDENVILKMNNTKKAEAFAITIEKKGGNPSPTLEKMQSMGKTKAKL